MDAPTLGWLGAIWGIGGVVVLLASAIYRLGRVALEGLAQPLTWYHWAALVPWLVFMLGVEGYQGFQRGFAPRVAARARYLATRPRPVHVLLAPVFCMALIHATPSRQRRAIGLVLGIVALVIVVRQLPQPWRAIVDLGVTAGLAWGLVVLCAFGYRAMLQDAFDYSPEVPPR